MPAFIDLTGQTFAHVMMRSLLLLLLAPVAFADVSVVDTDDDVDQDGTYTAGAGSDRVVLWTPGTQDTDQGWLTGATFDGDAMTADGGIQVHDTGSADFSAAIFRDPESGIPAGAATLSATVSAPVDGLQGSALTLAGVDQANPVVDSAAVTAGGVAAPHVFGRGGRAASPCLMPPPPLRTSRPLPATRQSPTPRTPVTRRERSWPTSC